MARAEREDCEANGEGCDGEREGVDSERDGEPVGRLARQARRGVAMVAGVLQCRDGARARREGEGCPVEACACVPWRYKAYDLEMWRCLFMRARAVSAFRKQGPFWGD